jgi:RNA polymerase sigma factor (sigma-70 family)
MEVRRSSEQSDALDPVVDAGADGSFDAFYLVEFPKMVAWASALTGDPAVGEELAQEAMIRSFRHWDRVSTYERPGAWVRRVTTNLASTARTRRRAESTAFERLATTASASGSEELRDAAEFWAFVRRLPKRQRDAVTLYYLEDRTIADIATELGCSKNTAKAHLFKGRRRLAGWLDAELDAEFDA